MNDNTKPTEPDDFSKALNEDAVEPESNEHQEGVRAALSKFAENVDDGTFQPPKQRRYWQKRPVKR